jgi:hypothetical protein
VPVEPDSTMIPPSYDGPVEPEFSNKNLSSMFKFVELIVVVVPSTNKVPVIETLPVAVTLANVTSLVVPTP